MKPKFDLHRMKGWARKIGLPEEDFSSIRNPQEMWNYLDSEARKEIGPKPPPIRRIHPMTKRWRERKLEQFLAKTKSEDQKRKFRQELAQLRGLELTEMWERCSSALKEFARDLVIENPPDDLATPQDFFQMIRSDVEKLLKENPRNKVKFILKCQMTKMNQTTGETEFAEPSFHSEVATILEGENVSELFSRMTGKILENFANFLRTGSNWEFVNVVNFTMALTRFRPLKGSSFIKTPPALRAKKAIVNMENDDQQCAKWAITRGLNPVEKNATRITRILRMQSEKLDWDGMTFPTPLTDFCKFERRNGIGVNVFGWENSQVVPLRISQIPGVDLMLFKEFEPTGSLTDDLPVNTHFCWIRNLNRLLHFQVSKHRQAMHFCRRCLNHFGSETKLAEHEKSCSQFESVRIDMPEEGEVVKWKNFGRKQKMPVVCFADFESRLVPIHSTQPPETGSFTEKFQKHVPVSFAFQCVSDVVKREMVLHRAENDEEDVGKKFVEELIAFVKDIQKEVKFPKKMKFGPEDQEAFESAVKCWLCEKEFEENDEIVRDHCHFTGKFRGAAHNKCNLQARKPKFTPVFFHNLKGYDAHFIVKALGEIPGEIKCLPNNEEKFISFSKMIEIGRWRDKDGKLRIDWHEIRFLDSMAFMATSLGNLTKNLTDEELIVTKEEFGADWGLAKKKGIFPYEWLDSVVKFKKQLPEKEAFFSRLNDEGVSEEAMENAREVWRRMDMRNMGDFHDFYLKSDVCLLADVFEEFRKVCMKHYDLDPAWFFTSPGLAWDAALKTSEVELELLTDPEMLLFVERGIRGGVSTIFHRRATANNKYLKDFNPEKPSVFVPYWDANGLYAWAMSHELPVGGFEWMGEDLEKWREFPCLLEVDVDIPEELHDKFNDFPPLPERIKVGGVEKLIPNLANKKKMIVHWRALKQALDLGCVLKKVWRGVKFREKAWLKGFIDKNVILRQKSRNAFEKDFFKLMNNAVFGKTMENIRKRKDIHLVNTGKQLVKFVAKPNFEHRSILTEDLVAVHMKRTKLKFDKPIYVGQAILDISKTCMFEFHYEYVKKKWPEAKLCFTDTDSLLYRIETDDLFEDLAGDVKERFDTSEFVNEHPRVVDGTIRKMNKKVLGLMKDETCGKPILEFVGLRAKCYSLKLDEGGGVKKCKGVKKGVVKKRICHEDYVNVLESGKAQMRKMNCLRSEKHEISTLTVNKTALSAEDDKRIVLEDGVSTLAWGHWREDGRMPGDLVEGRKMKSVEEQARERLEKKKVKIERFMKNQAVLGETVSWVMLKNKFYVKENDLPELGVVLRGCDVFFELN